MKKPSNIIKIEKISEKDIPSVRQIESECFGSKFHENFEALLQSSSYLYLLAKCQDDIVGYGGASIQYEQSDLLYVATKSEFQRRGIASLILKNLFEGAKERGAQKMFLEVEVDNQAAINLYKKLGFELISERKNYYGNKSALIFIKEL